MGILKKIFLITLIAFIIMQFGRPGSNINSKVLETDFSKTLIVPPEVLDILKNSCFDCHSNNTRYPWYYNIQPFGWTIAKHIREGKANLNFSEFGTYSKRKQANKLRAIEMSINDGSMPLKAYRILHIDARLNKENKDLINNWASHTTDSLLKN